MAITKSIEIDGRQVPFKASAAVPRIYRLKFGRDIFSDIDKLVEAGVAVFCAAGNDGRGSSLLRGSIRATQRSRRWMWRP